MNLTIERALPAEAAELVRVQIAAFHHDAVLYPGVVPDGPPGYDSVEVMQGKITGDDVYTLRADGVCVGGMAIFDHGAGHYHLDVIFIDPAYHSQGIGSRALAFLMHTYPARHWTLDTPQWSTRNHHFYEKHGFIRGEAFAAPDGTPLFAYEKIIPAAD